MANSVENIYKIVEPIGTMATAAWGLVGQVQKRFNHIRSIKERGAEPGAFFFLTYILFQYVYAVALVLCGLFGLVALVGGIAEIVRPPNGLRYVSPLFGHYAYPILGIAILLFIAAALNILSWISILLLAWIPPKFLPPRQSAAWYNLWQFASPFGEPTPLFINPEGVSRLSDIAISRLETTGLGRENFAETPIQLSLDERANAALIGCIFEKEHGVRKWARSKWRPLYAAVANAEVNGHRLVSPTYLASTAPNVDFFEILRADVNRRLPTGEPCIPDSAEARNDLSDAVKLLVNKYKASARNLAVTWWSSKPNLRVAFDRSRSFPLFDSASMVPQFLKLVVRWEVWPGAALGNFIYPYASYLAVSLFEEHALVTLPGDQSFAFQNAGQLAAFRETMRRIVMRVHQSLSGSMKPEHVEILRRYPSEWELAAAVDFVLWSYSREKKEKPGFKEWKVDEEHFVTRKEAGGVPPEHT